MYLKYYLFALLKVFLLFTIPPMVLGMVLGFFGRGSVKNQWIVTGAFVGVLEIFVWIEKGSPLFWANIYYMFSLSPIMALRVVIGIAGLALTAWYCRGAVKYGVELVDRCKSFRKVQPAE